MKSLISLALAGTCLAMPMTAQAAIISFDDLAGDNGTVFSSYSEDGFLISATGGEIFNGKSFGNPTPSLVVGSVFQGGPSGSFNVTLSSGGMFSFDGFDLIGNNGLADYTVQGFSGASSIFSFSGSQGNGFATIGGSAGAIDRLSFSLTANGTSLNIDNLNVSAIPGNGGVPEPSTWAMMLLGFFSVGGMVRAGKRARNMALSRA